MSDLILLVLCDPFTPTRSDTAHPDTHRTTIDGEREEYSTIETGD